LDSFVLVFGCCSFSNSVQVCSAIVKREVIGVRRWLERRVFLVTMLKIAFMSNMWRRGDRADDSVCRRQFQGLKSRKPHCLPCLCQEQRLYWLALTENTQVTQHKYLKSLRHAYKGMRRGCIVLLVHVFGSHMTNNSGLFFPLFEVACTLWPTFSFH